MSNRRLLSLSVGAILIFTIVACNVGKNVTAQLNVEDSLSVQRFIQTHNICEKLNYIEQHKIAIVKDKAYARMIAISIVQETQKPISIPTATFNYILTEEQQVNDLQEQIDEIRLSCNCEKK